MAETNTPQAEMPTRPRGPTAKAAPAHPPFQCASGHERAQPVGVEHAEHADDEARGQFKRRTAVRPRGAVDVGQ